MVLRPDERLRRPVLGVECGVVGLVMLAWPAPLALSIYSKCGRIGSLMASADVGVEVESGGASSSSVHSRLAISSGNDEWWTAQPGVWISTGTVSLRRDRMLSAGQLSFVALMLY